MESKSVVHNLETGIAAFPKLRWNALSRSWSGWMIRQGRDFISPKSLYAGVADSTLIRAETPPLLPERTPESNKTDTKQNGYTRTFCRVYRQCNKTKTYRCFMRCLWYMMRTSASWISGGNTLPEMSVPIWPWMMRVWAKRSRKRNSDASWRHLGFGGQRLPGWRSKPLRIDGRRGGIGKLDRGPRRGDGREIMRTM